MSKLKSIVFADLTPVRAVAVAANVSFGLGLLLLDSSTANYAGLLQIASACTWAYMFIIYSVFKFWSMMDWVGARWKAVIDVSGVWLWSFIFLSFSIFDTEPMRAGEPVVFIMALMHVWLLTERPKER